MYRTSEKTSLSRKMVELEDRWRKSQEDRYVLELKFKEVLKGLADKNEGAKLLRIREKYHCFLENEDNRNQRNDQILRVLDKIESQANIFAAKTERLRLLKNPYCFSQLHYEAYMKRMYPTWKTSQDEEECVSSKKRESFFPSSRKQRKEGLSYNSPRREDNISTKLTYHNPPYVDKSPYNVNVLCGKNVGPLVLPNMDSGNNPSGQSRSENIRLFDLNRGFSNIDINPKRKSGDSRELSVEQEENTSKDLLNVSLSEDSLVNDSTIPVEVRITEEQSQIKSEHSSSANAKFVEAADRENPRSNSSIDNLNRKLDSNNLRFDREESLIDKPVGVEYNRKDSDFDNGNTLDGRKLRNSSSKKRDFVDRSVKEEVDEHTYEFKPSVVITQPTPDIGRASSEEDINRKVADVSEDGERVRSESDGIEKVKYPFDEELSPRPFTALDNLGDNVEEPFHFSSSDADYDELENQMAAMVERKRYVFEVDL